MPRPRTMSIGGATYDLFVRTDHSVIGMHEGAEAFMLPLGGKIRVQDVIETCGGGACNSSVGLSRLGCEAGFSGVMGDDQWGQKLLENLKKENVDTRCATVVEHEVSSFSIILSAASGERVILYTPGTNAHLHDVTFDRETTANMDWVYLNRMQDASCVIENDLIAIFDAGNTPSLTWNPGGCHIETGMNGGSNPALLSYADLLLLNKEEAHAFTGEPDIPTALHMLHAAGATNVCITDGAAGTWATDGAHLYVCPVIEDTKVIDTTGAGDAFGIGVTWGLLQGKNLPESLRAGTINAASVVESFGAQAGLLTDTQMNERLSTLRLAVEVRPL